MYTAINTCFGGTFDTVSRLDVLRFCQLVIGSLTISVNDPNADFSNLYDMNNIEGMIKFTTDCWRYLIC